MDVQVDVYSACEEVELRLNGRTIGRNTTGKASRYMASWVVPYEPGTLEAIGFRGGKKVASQTLRTAGEPARLRLTPDRKVIDADGYDLSFVTVEVLDRNGRLHPNAEDLVRFSISGPGRIAGVGNGDPASIESFQANKRKAYNGRCQVVVKSRRGAQPGTITLGARAKGLAEWKLMLKYPVRVAIIPVVSSLGFLLPGLIGGQAIISIVLGLPTFGPMLLDAIRSQDMYLAGSVVMVQTALVIVGVFLSDMLLMVVDPRIRLTGGTK